MWIIILGLIAVGQVSASSNAPASLPAAKGAAPGKDAKAIQGRWVLMAGRTIMGRDVSVDHEPDWDIKDGKIDFLYFESVAFDKGSQTRGHRNIYDRSVPTTEGD